MAGVDPRRGAPAPRPAVLSPAGRERADYLRRLCLGAEPAARRDRQAGVPSAGSAFLQGVEARSLRIARPRSALKARSLPYWMSSKAAKAWRRTSIPKP